MKKQYSKLSYSKLSLITIAISSSMFASAAVYDSSNTTNSTNVVASTQEATTQTKGFWATLVSLFTNQDRSADNQPTQQQSTKNQTNTPTILHSMAFDTDARARQMQIADKRYGSTTDAIYRDGFGREALFRGWNVSGAHKLASMKFMPFKNVEDAADSFGKMGQMMGANQIRFTISWEGVHPAPDVIDYDYLDAVTAQMREAIKRRMYIVVDYHSDLYTRHTFTKDSLDTGNGAPEWIVKGGNHGTDSCGLPCLFTWSAHKLSDGATRSAIRAFWLNAPIRTTKGTRYVQTEFLWQLGKVSDYLNQNLSASERDYVLGIAPLNEPFDGGIKELGLRNYSEFDNQILWPFYERARQAMDGHGMYDKLLYAEPLVFWYTNTGIIQPETGYGFLNYKPGKRFVFSPHLYDQGRMGLNDLTMVENAAYLHKLDEVRNESRRLGMPIFLGEYGMWNTGKGRQDPKRIINASIQALETSNGQTQNLTTKRVDVDKASRFADFYTPFIHGAQWHWNHYYNKSSEYQNGNLNKLVTADDAWNKEDFSVVDEYSSQHMHGAAITERSYPRRMQGDLMHFAYNAQVSDTDAKMLNWHSIRVDLANEFENREYFRNRKFAIAVWRGRKADAPTEIYVPRSFNPVLTTVITDKVIEQGVGLSITPKHTTNEVMLTKDADQWANSGHRLLVWDDADADENTDSMHYALIVEHTSDMDADELKTLQDALNQRILQEKTSAVYLPSAMTFSPYPADSGSQQYFQLVEQTSNTCMDVNYGNTTDGTAIVHYHCNPYANPVKTNQRWQYDTTTGRITTQLDNNKCLTVAGVPSNGKNLEIRTCDNSLNQRQQFIRTNNWGWALKTNPQLLIGRAGNGNRVGLWQQNGQNDQKWVVRY